MTQMPGRYENSFTEYQSTGGIPDVEADCADTGDDIGKGETEMFGQRYIVERGMLWFSVYEEERCYCSFDWALRRLLTMRNISYRFFTTILSS